jgi:hypothetical protein
MVEDELDKFIGEILTAKNLSGINEEVRIQLISDMKERLLDQINRAIIEAMPENKLDEFNKLLDSGDASDDIVQQFIGQCGVDVKTVTVKTMLLFRDLYLQTAKERKV